MDLINTQCLPGIETAMDAGLHVVAVHAACGCAHQAIVAAAADCHGTHRGIRSDWLSLWKEDPNCQLLSRNEMPGMGMSRTGPMRTEFLFPAFFKDKVHMMSLLVG